ncbi:hypothetical protein CNMCM8980_010202 [Aspergillus fumigatiaffinis]|uniref:F-box domain-containing protein n=1 Tax=Aspergillus fumigatiaffinis TaxID=340414 RepID=A0A8H4ME54_9EURO|nr:hypothetical protein CNMCM5878_007063 [Aspergillus fumigatiaffinis]KAF4241245.1 hypothetical protein CNMCM6457_006348 [Aspergillus fumigatiaffinis]KAF4242721.1 hypothetical protein CNMCM6805_002345 [Aspergillus fumigatiaffinis]KAF4244390.1 hypothetical protein CNMCM8980_010202 [Aspergillus fumigatiaffinis]
MSFQVLPPEIISLVVRFLADVHPLSVFRLLRVNKRCFALALSVAKSLVFHTVRLQFCHRERIDNQAAAVSAKLQKADAFRYVRRLIIEGFLSGDPPEEEYDDEWFPARVSRFSPLNRDPRDSYEFEEELNGTGWDLYYRDGDIDFECWESVAGLIQRLPALENLHHMHYEQFPPCLLQALHQYRPECRLHLHSFVLRSIWEPTAEEHEYCLVTSPSLHSITPYYDTSIPEGIWQKQSFVQILGLAPNLKVMYPRASDDRTYNLSGAGMTKLMQNPGDKHPAAIECLRVKHSYFSMLAAALEEWVPYIDFSTVQILDLGSSIKAEAFAAWTDQLHFPALRTLRLFLGPKDAGAEQTPDFCTQATRFLQSLPSLSEIHLIAWHSQLSIGTLTKHHGRCLRKLSVTSRPWQCFSEHDILQVGRYCPLLEKLSIPIRRTKGDAREVALYKALGTIRNLKFLDLELNVSDPTLYQENASIDSDWDNFDNQYTDEDLQGVNRSRNGHIRNLLVNTLIDEALASSIFEVISAAKSQDAPVLERLTLPVKGQAHRYYRPRCEFSWLVRFFASEWTIERDLRYEHRDKFEARISQNSNFQFSYNESIGTFGKVFLWL